MKFVGWIITLLSCTAVAAQNRLVAGGTGTSLYVSYIVPGGSLGWSGRTIQCAIGPIGKIQYHESGCTPEKRGGDQGAAF